MIVNQVQVKHVKQQHAPIPAGYRSCTACNGTGVYINGDVCPECRGTGQVAKSAEPKGGWSWQKR